MEKFKKSEEAEEKLILNIFSDARSLGGSFEGGHLFSSKVASTSENCNCKNRFLPEGAMIRSLNMAQPGSEPKQSCSIMSCTGAQVTNKHMLDNKKSVATLSHSCQDGPSCGPS